MITNEIGHFHRLSDAKMVEEFNLEGKRKRDVDDDGKRRREREKERRDKRDRDTRDRDKRDRGSGSGAVPVCPDWLKSKMTSCEKFSKGSCRYGGKKAHPALEE